MWLAGIPCPEKKTAVESLIMSVLLSCLYKLSWLIYCSIKIHEIEKKNYDSLCDNLGKQLQEKYSSVQARFFFIDLKNLN